MRELGVLVRGKAGTSFFQAENVSLANKQRVAFPSPLTREHSTVCVLEKFVYSKNLSM